MPDASRRSTSRSSGPRGRTGPGRSGRGPSRASGGSRPDDGRPDEAREVGGASRPARPGRPTGSARTSGDGPATGRRRPRLTGRALVLLLVVGVLVVSYASSARAYLQQRSEITALQSQISETQASISDMETEKKRWKDEAYVEQQARELGYVMPGETSYTVLDEDGEPLEQDNELTDPDAVVGTDDPGFWEEAWSSVLLAGDPTSEDTSTPATEIDGSSGD
ncbi:septum formation initiator family protein [Nocardioides sp. GY 10127]|uniref:FtsB family cell division protein n=1 Tax=Nocardioides sp. GY 10127 TaxID=2569762 RepID=UPI0010A7D64E|nr:septum formation initiator family protein [Nocardioides sp. GY 10127]TIC81827.1 septum formation initiator family protein [Nocardioides sp. GY 10127]